jgi:hypothetical protein
MNFNNLDKDELAALLFAYDEYIQNANEDDRFSDGWYPVCISEFYDCEFQAQNDYEPDL